MADMTKTDGVWQMTIQPGQTATLSTGGKYSDADITVTANGYTFDTNNQFSFENNNNNNIILNDYMEYKDYNYFIAAGDNNPNGYYYFGQIKPTSQYVQWKIKFRMHMEVPYSASVANSQYMSYEGTCELYGYANNVTTYKIYNSHNHTSYRTFYHYEVYRAKTASVMDCGHLMGLRFQSAYAPTNTNYKRNIHIELLETKNCAFTFFDDMKLYANCPNTGSTNYEGRTEFDGANNGLRETGDDNTFAELRYNNNSLYTSKDFRTPGYCLLAFDKEDRLQALSLYQANYDGIATNANVNRVYNSNGVDWKRGLYYTEAWYNYVPNTRSNQSLWIATSNRDLRYSDNCVAINAANVLTLTYTKPIYLRGIIKEDGLFYFRPLEVTYTDNKVYKRCWTQDIPTTVEKDADGYQYTYWFVGYPYYNSSYANGGYQYNLWEENPMFWYHNGKFVKYTDSFNDTKNTAGATDTSDKIYLVGAPTQTANPQTYTDDEVYVTDGRLNTKEVQIGNASSNVTYKCDTRTFTKRKHDGAGIYATANDQANGTYYFGSFRPNSLYEPAKIKLEIFASVPSNNNYVFSAEIEYIFLRLNAPTYHLKAQMNSTSYRPLYYISINRTTSTGYTNGYGHLLGFSMQSSTNPTSASYLRQIKVNVLEIEGGTFDWIDTDAVYKATDISYYNTTNYAEITQYDVNNTRSLGSGLQLSNTYDRTYMDKNMLENGSFRCHNYSIFGFDREGKMQSLSVVGTAATTTLTATDATTPRTYNTNGIDYTRGFAYIGNTLYGENVITGNGITPYPIMSAIDFRYTDNCLANNTTTAYPNVCLQPAKPVYIRGYIKEDDLFYLAPIEVDYNSKKYKKVWVQEIPESVEKDSTNTYRICYWFLGYPRYSGDTNYVTNYYQINIWPTHPMFVYDGSAIVEYSKTLVSNYNEETGTVILNLL